MNLLIAVRISLFGKKEIREIEITTVESCESALCCEDLSVWKERNKERLR